MFTIEGRGFLGLARDPTPQAERGRLRCARSSDSRGKHSRDSGPTSFIPGAEEGIPSQPPKPTSPSRVPGGKVRTLPPPTPWTLPPPPTPAPKPGRLQQQERSCASAPRATSLSSPPGVRAVLCAVPCVPCALSVLTITAVNSQTLLWD